MGIVVSFFIYFEIQGLIGDTHVLFSLQIIWIAVVIYLPPFYDRVRIDDHCAHFVRNKGEGQCVEGTPSERKGRESVFLLCYPHLLPDIIIALPPNNPEIQILHFTNESLN